jgi:CRISPR-associated protein Csm4
MGHYRLTLQPLTAFGTPLAGDTLFGQLCWTLRHQHGNDRLNELLQGYTAGQPFAVISDAHPHGFIPLPSLPSRIWKANGDDRKTLKKKRWLPVAQLGQPLPDWQSLASSDAQVAEVLLGKDAVAHTERAQPHNTLSRTTGTTGEGQFAPYTMPQIWFHPAMRFDLYIALDETRLGIEELGAALTYMGKAGFGRDASIGLGKFQMESAPAAHAWPEPANANAWLTLGPCAPQGQGFCTRRSFYQTLTRFGRHGDAAAQTGNPFKRPVMLARGGSVFWPEQPNIEQTFIGQGIAGVSDAMPETVHQGYAPVLPIALPLEAKA